MPSTGPHAGGAAAAHGSEFQARVAAWYAARILAEQPIGDGAGSAGRFLRCETEQPVDDILVALDDGGAHYVQVKASLRLETSPASDLASTVRQFVRQYIVNSSSPIGAQPWQRPLDPARDRLVLVVGPNSSGSIRTFLRKLLHRTRLLPSTHPLDSLPMSEDERSALATVSTHICSAWRSVTGVTPTETQLRNVLAFSAIEVLDVDPQGAQEREAKDLLARFVLESGHPADLAWSALVQACSEFASSRTGTDRNGLRTTLEQRGARLRAPQRYERDIIALRQWACRELKALAPLSRIEVAGITVKLPRAATIALSEAAAERGLVVVGEPGAGKSGVLYDFAMAHITAGRDVVVLLADHLTARNRADLRTELSLDHDLVDVLTNWPSAHPGYLVIDALDAARAEDAARTIRDILRNLTDLATRWRVVVSIRKFDLRYSPELQGMFRGPPVAPDNSDPEFGRVRHLNVPCLSTTEVCEVGRQVPGLASVLERATPALLALVRVPFNLSLLAQLAGEGAPAAALSGIGTAVGLLDEYWFRRVIHDTRGDARERALRIAANAMLHARQLRVSRSVVADSTGAGDLIELLSAHLLTEWDSGATTRPDRYTLTFPHHILFDYAAARLCFPDAPAALVQRLEGEPDLALSARPSLDYLFQARWNEQGARPRFWSSAFEVAGSSSLPAVAKLIAPAVAAQSARELRDLSPIIEALSSPDKARVTTAVDVLRHVVGALTERHRSNLEEFSDVWGEFVAALPHTDLAVAYAVRPLLYSLKEVAKDPASRAMQGLGNASRALLRTALDVCNGDSALAASGIELVTATAATAPSDSITALGRLLEDSRVQQHGYRDLFWLAQQVESLTGISPDFVERIYIRAFTFRDTSSEPTSLGSGRILGLTSRRSQDYSGGLYALADAFPDYVRAAPLNATRVVVAALAYYADSEHAGSERPRRVEFDLLGRRATLITDYSSIWDSTGTYSHDDPLRLLGHFEAYLDEIADAPESLAILHDIVDTIATLNQHAVLWRRLLLWGGAHPGSVGTLIREMAWSDPVLRGFDTRWAVGEFLRSAYIHLSTAERQRVEGAVLGLVQGQGEQRASEERARDMLLGCLTRDAIVSQAAQAAVALLERAGVAPENIPAFSFSGVRSRPYGERECLEEAGVPVDDPANIALRGAEAPVQSLSSKHLNVAPTESELPNFIAALQKLASALALTQGAHAAQLAYARRTLVEGAARAAKCDSLQVGDSSYAFLREILLDASRSPEPPPEPPESFISPSWGSAPRINAASGLIHLVQTGSDADVRQAIDALARDPNPAVRFQVASAVIQVYEVDQDWMWALIEDYSREELSPGVLVGVIDHGLHSLAGAYPDRVASLASDIRSRAATIPKSEAAQQRCLSILFALAVWRAHVNATALIDALIQELPRSARNLSEVVSDVRDLLGNEVQDAPPEMIDAARGRAWSLISEIVRRCGSLLTDNAALDGDSGPEVAKLVDHIAAELYFASGAFDAKGTSGSPVLISRERGLRFLDESAGSLEGIADAAIPSASYHMLELLLQYIPIDPRRVFLLTARTVSAATRNHIQFESLAVDLVVTLVERYLADYPDLLRDEACRPALLATLDSFVAAGWPSARRLVYGLEDVYR